MLPAFADVRVDICRHIDKQAHKPGTSTFALNDNKIWVLAADDQPIKVVNEGEGLMIAREATENADLTQEYVYGQGVGVAAICAAKLGVFFVFCVSDPDASHSPQKRAQLHVVLRLLLPALFRKNAKAGLSAPLNVGIFSCDTWLKSTPHYNGPPHAE